MIEKSLKDISWLVSEDEYRNDPALSYSTMAKYEREGFNKLSTLFDRVESPSLTFGSMVDAIITGGEDEFNSRFYVCDLDNNVSEQQIKILHKIKDSFPSDWIGTLKDVPDDCIDNACIEVGYGNTWRASTRVSKIRETGSQYFNMLVLAQDKTVVSNELYTQALNAVDALRSADATKWYFAEDNPFDDVERLYQLKFKGEYNGIPMRCMMDEVAVDHKNKIIIPIDLKTSYKPEWDFPKSFLEWHYMIQGSSYYYILKQNLAKDPYFKDFKVLNYRFIVVNKETLTPLVWEFEGTDSDEDMIVNGITYRHWKKILPELKFYLDTEAKVPNGVNATGLNSIETYFKIKDNEIEGKCN